ncbi:MAG: hypothetical protein KGI33_07770 [Thaumarchaeota archaeon]|nr:hypothetical protein [Nitrososphaerota archaeon]
MPPYDSLDELCGNIIRINKNIQSVSVINKMGRLVETTSRPEHSQRFPSDIKEHLLMQCVLQISMGRDFDEYYGPINYHISERANLTLLTFPVEEGVILVTCNKNVSPITLAKKVALSINDYIKQASLIEM